MPTQIIYGQAPESQFTVELRRKLDFKTVKILNKVLKSCSWDYDRNGGCGKATVELVVDPIDMQSYQGADYELRISIRNAATESETLYYRGYQEEYKPTVDRSGKVTLSFSGYSSMLKRVRVNATYEYMEVGAIIRSILDTYVSPYYPITYTLANHDVSGYVPDRITFDTDAGSAIKTLATLAGDFEYGVDRNLEFYFKQSSTVVQHFLKYKKDLKTVNESWDYGGIVNQFIIKGAGGYEDTANNTESQAVYGLRSKTVSNSAIITNSVSQRYGSGLLAVDARPKRRISATKLVNNTLFESTVPLKMMAIIKEPVVAPTKYGATPKYGMGILYGGVSSYSIDKITYRLQSEGTGVTFNLGQPQPDFALQIAQIQNDINQIRNS